MSSRLYLQGADVTTLGSGVTPSVGTWNDTSLYALRGFSSYNTKSAQLAQLIALNTGALASTLLANHISPPLQAQTIGGTVKGVFKFNIQTSVTGCTAVPRIIINIINPAGTIASTLLSSWQGTNALTTANTNRFCPVSGTSLSSQSCNTGDRISIETGIIRTAGTTARNGQILYTSVQASDLAEDEVGTTTLNSWIEFSQTLLFSNGITYFQ